jgi:hypothetical protein
MALCKSVGAFIVLKTSNITFIGNESKWQLFLPYRDLKEKGKIVPFQTMNAYQGSRGIKPLIHNFCTRWK